MNKERVYLMLKQQWITENPNASPAEYEAAMRDIARKVGI